MAEYINREKLPPKKKRGSYLVADFNAGWNACLDEVNSIPSADVVDRKTGTWIEIRRNDRNPLTGKCGVYVGCSECGAPLPTDSYLDFIDESDCKFCYNCGAKMSGGDDDV